MQRRFYLRIALIVGLVVFIGSVLYVATNATREAPKHMETEDHDHDH